MGSLLAVPTASPGWTAVAWVWVMARAPISCRRRTAAGACSIRTSGRRPTASAASRILAAAAAAPPASRPSTAAAPASLAQAARAPSAAAAASSGVSPACRRRPSSSWTSRAAAAAASSTTAAVAATRSWRCPGAAAPRTQPCRWRPAEASASSSVTCPWRPPTRTCTSWSWRSRGSRPGASGGSRPKARRTSMVLMWSSWAATLRPRTPRGPSMGGSTAASRCRSNRRRYP
mmetsp:Transcript_99423/g.319017  ORF Transcript_99423/g.319017 Transcript_99423/m.319017 type:complete len:232 (-) Transcript_99423:95-790(-)